MDIRRGADLAMLAMVGVWSASVPLAEATLRVQNGNFEADAEQTNDVTGWYNSIGDTATSWWEATWSGPNVSPNGTSVLGLSYYNSTENWAYQSIGTNTEAVTSLIVQYDIGSFTDAGGVRDLGLRFSIYEAVGDFTPGNSLDIASVTNGVVLIDEVSVVPQRIGIGEMLEVQRTVLDLSSASTTGELFLRIQNEPGGEGEPWVAVDNVGVFSDEPAFGSIEVSPTGTGVGNPVVLSAVIAEWGATFEYASFFFDGEDYGMRDSSYTDEGVVTAYSYDFSFDPGTVHTAMVVVAGMNPVGYATNEWTFTMGDGFTVVSQSPTDSGITNPVTVTMSVADLASTFDSATMYFDGVEVVPSIESLDGTNTLSYTLESDLDPGTVHSVSGMVYGVNPSAEMAYGWTFSTTEPFEIEMAPNGYVSSRQPEITAEIKEVAGVIDNAYLYLDGVEVNPEIWLGDGGWQLSYTPEEALEVGTTHTGMVVVLGQELIAEFTNTCVFGIGGELGMATIYSTNNPVPEVDDVYQFSAATSDGYNVAGGADASTYIATESDRGAQGQYFTTGAGTAYELTSVWLQHVPYGDTWSQLNAGDTYTVRIVDPSKVDTAGFVLCSEVLTVANDSLVGMPSSGTGRWIQYVLNSPVTLKADKMYGFDVACGSDGNEFYEISGVNSNAYEGGSAYMSGGSGVGDNGANEYSSADRTFLVALTEVDALPDVTIVSTSPSGTVLDNAPVLEVLIEDNGVSVDPYSAVLLLDGVEVVPDEVSKLNITSTLVYVSSDLADGVHTGAVVAVPGGETNRWTFSVVYASAGVYIHSADNPDFDDDDIFQFAASTNDAFNVAGGADSATYIATEADRGAQGQFFTTGSGSAYEVSSVWLKHVSYSNTWSAMNAGDTFMVRIVDPSQTNSAGFLVYSEELTVLNGDIQGMPANPGSGCWIEHRFSQPVALDAGRTYGFDVACGAGGNEFYEISGVNTNLYAGGSAYMSGASGVGDTTATVYAGSDRSFMVVMNEVDAPITVESPVIRRDGQDDGVLSLSWPVSYGSAFNVLTNGDLVNGIWKSADLVPFLDGDRYVITNAMGSGTTLFIKLESK